MHWVCGATSLQLAASRRASTSARVALPLFCRYNTAAACSFFFFAVFVVFLAFAGVDDGRVVTFVGELKKTLSPSVEPEGMLDARSQS